MSVCHLIKNFLMIFNYNWESVYGIDRTILYSYLTEVHTCRVYYILLINKFTFV